MVVGEKRRALGNRDEIWNRIAGNEQGGCGDEAYMQ